MAQETTQGVDDLRVPDEAALAQIGERDNRNLPDTRPSMDLATAGNETFLGDIKFPWLKIAHGVGGLAHAGFQPGCLVLGNEYEIYSPERKSPGTKGQPPTVTPASAPLRIIIWNYTEYWKEYLSKEMTDAGLQPRIFQTRQAALDAGLTVEYNNVTKTPPSAPMAMTWLLLIEKPADVLCPLFCVEAQGVAYAPAYMAIDKMAYRAVSQPFGIAARYTLKVRGMKSALWSLETAQQTARTTGNVTWVPRIRQVESLTDEQLNALKAALSGSQDAALPVQEAAVEK